MRGWSPRAVVAAVAFLTLPAIGAAEEAPGAGGFLRVQWHVTELREPVPLELEGYVYNSSSIRVTDVRLHVVERDRAARPVGRSRRPRTDVPSGVDRAWAISRGSGSDYPASTPEPRWGSGRDGRARSC